MPAELPRPTCERCGDDVDAGDRFCSRQCRRESMPDVRDAREAPDAATRYRCPDCGSTNVELCFPVWVPANDIDDRARWDLDDEASPEKDGDKGWCPDCADHVLVEEVPRG